MAAKFFDLELSSLVFTKSHSTLTRNRIGKKSDRGTQYDAQYDFKTFVYDCFFDPSKNEVVLLCPPLLNFRNLLSTIKFSVDGTTVMPKTVSDISRCSVITFSPPNTNPSTITISHQLFGANLTISASHLDAFKGTNAIYTISQNNRLEWIQDWLEYYVKNHGANAVVLSDNESTDYSVDELSKAICAVQGIEVVAVIRARFPFGPTGSKNYSSLFLQRSMAELCRRRLLGNARAVINADIDELFYSFSGRSMFDAAIESEIGYVRADAEWVYAKRNKLDAPARHRDHAFVSSSGKPKANRKWCVVPQGPQKDRQWLTHFLDSKNDQIDPDFRLWHFRQISTGWKYDRSDFHKSDLKKHPELISAMKSTSKSK